MLTHFALIKLRHKIIIIIIIIVKTGSVGVCVLIVILS